MSKEHPGQKLCQTFSIPSDPLGFIFSPENTNRSSFSFASLACFLLHSWLVRFGTSRKENVILVATKSKISVRTDLSALRCVAWQNKQLLLNSFPWKGAFSSCG